MSHQSVWKAREYLLWIVFCVPCLKGLLKTQYLHHVSLLSAAVNILMQRSITLQDLNKADNLLWWYTYYYQAHFRERRMVYNVHLLSHVKFSVKNFGPLWRHSAFPYEGKNQYILKLAKNHSSVATEIAIEFTIYQSLPKLCSTLNLRPQTRKFVNAILNHKLLVRCVRSSGNSILLGKPQYLDSVVDKRTPLHPGILKTCLVFVCVLVYCDGKGQNDSCVLLISGQYALIQNFLKTPDGSLLVDVKILMLERKPVFTGKYVKILHVMAIQGLGERKCVPISDIQEPCFFIDTVSGTYVSRLPYGCTVELYYFFN